MDNTFISNSFHRVLIKSNSLENRGFKEWLVHPAMLFNSHSTWWGDKGKRKTPHEGLDFYSYRTLNGGIKYLDDKTKIPALFSGTIENISPDFLGMSVFISHDNYKKNTHRLFTIYGHITPDNTVQPGKQIREGDIIGTIASSAGNDKSAPPHLHISLSWISDTFQPNDLNWQTISNSPDVKFIDPLDIIKCPYSLTSNLHSESPL